MSKVVAKTLLTVLFATAFFFLGCSGKSESDADVASTLKAVANMAATTGNQARGTVTFTQESSGVRVTVHFEDVPEGTHGFHIHEFGDCSSGDGTSAGGHFNPEGNPHAGPNAEKRHIGDLGNLVANASGIVDKEFVDSHLRLEGPNSIIGKGVILHADPDDLTSQPTGAAGARISCGVITKSE
ncbi:superoxide dismutase family protein [bacterium]|nr:superoxide dismutase family protein [bacterium]